MKNKTFNKIVGGLEVLAGAVLISKSEEYGFGDAGKYIGGFFMLEGTADIITGEWMYLINNLPSKINKHIRKR